MFGDGNIGKKTYYLKYSYRSLDDMLPTVPENMIPNIVPCFRYRLTNVSRDSRVLQEYISCNSCSFVISHNYCKIQHIQLRINEPKYCCMFQRIYKRFIFDKKIVVQIFVWLFVEVIEFLLIKVRGIHH